MFENVVKWKGCVGGGLRGRGEPLGSAPDREGVAGRASMMVFFSGAGSGVQAAVPRGAGARQVGPARREGCVSAGDGRLLVGLGESTVDL